MLSRECSGFIHSIFRNSLNLVISNNLVTISSKKGFEDWYSLNIDSAYLFNENFDYTEINKEILIFKKSIILFPNNKIQINFGDCELIYSPKFVDLFYSKKQLLEKLTYILKYRKHNLLSFQKGFNSLYDLILDFNLDKKNPNEDNHYIFTKIKNLLYGLQCEDEYLIEENIEKIIGYGIGLTPSGDDFLYGLVSFFWLTSKYFNLYIEEFNILKGCILNFRKNTNFISWTLLSRALEGKFSIIVHNLLQYIFMKNSSVNNLDILLFRMLKLGYSSGVDTLLGISFGIFYTIFTEGKNK